MRHGQGQDRNGDGRTVHIDRRSQRDADAVELFIQTEPFAQVHIDGDVRCRGTGKERVQAALLQALPIKRIRILPDVQPGDEGIDNEGGAAHAAHQQEKEFSVVRENLQAALRNRGIDEAKDAERGELDHPAHDLRDDIGQVADHTDGVLRR